MQEGALVIQRPGMWAAVTIFSALGWYWSFDGCNRKDSETTRKAKGIVNTMCISGTAVGSLALMSYALGMRLGPAFRKSPASTTVAPQPTASLVTPAAAAPPASQDEVGKRCDAIALFDCLPDHYIRLRACHGKVRT